MYSNNGLAVTVKDAKNQLTTYQYDGHDRKLKTLYPDKVTAGASSATDFEQVAYDADSNVTSIRKRNGLSITLAYDNLNRLLSRTYPTAADNISFSYDLLGRKTAANKTGYAIGYVYDNAGRLTSTAAGGKTLAYQYDPAGNRTRTTWPEATPFYITASYDALNRPTAILENGTVSLASYAYDDLSRRTTVSLGNGTTTVTGYDTQSALASLTQNLAGTDSDNTWSYTRNQVQDIKAASWSNDAYQPSHFLFTNGTRSYTANGLNQYATAAGSTLSYDANGNLGGDGVWTYAYLCPLGYNLDNQLTAANKTGSANSLAYDGAGRLSQTTLAGVVTNLSYDGSDLVAEYNSTGTLLRRYVHGPGVDEPLVAYNGAGTTAKFWLYADHQGSIVATAMSDGNIAGRISYDPYGANDGDGTLFRFRYTGQQLLGPLNLYYYKARFYSPAIGRFLQTDPIGYKDGLNWYAYVGNNPFNRNDPSGLAAIADFLSKGIKVVNQFLESHPKTDIPFNNGFPDFSSVTIKEVNIANLSGTAKDFDLANRAAGLSKTPEGYTWHHVEDASTMQLVPRDIHAATGHTGGAAWLKAGGSAAGLMAAGNADASTGILGTGITWKDMKNFATDMLTDPSTYYAPLMLLTPSSTGGCSNGVCSDMVRPATSSSASK